MLALAPALALTLALALALALTLFLALPLQAAELCDKGLQATDGSRHAPALLLIKG